MHWLPHTPLLRRSLAYHHSNVEGPCIAKMASTGVHPPGGTWFDTVKRSFVDVPIDANRDNAIATSEFLEAAESLATLFGAWYNFN